MPQTTSALVVREAGKAFALEDIKIDDPRDDEAIVEIHATGLCHSDLIVAAGKFPAPMPIVLGHEGAGVVLETGKDVTDVRPGDKVLLSYASCSACEHCLSGMPYYCLDWPMINLRGQRPDGTNGLTLADGTKLHGNFFGQSSFAGLALVHKSSLIKVPEHTPLDLFCSLGCGVQTGAGAVLNTLNVQSNNSVAIFGVGSVGLSAIMACKIRQAKTIIAVDLNASRLELARELGATDVVNAADKDVAQQIRDICKSNGVNRALDCTGNMKAIETMLDALGTKGRGCSVGIPPPDARLSVDVVKHITLGKEYVGCCEGESNSQEMTQYFIEQHGKDLLPLEKITTTYDINDYKQALEDVETGKTIKAVFIWKK